MSAIEETNREILSSLRRQWRRRADRRRALRPIRAIDALIAELEELHLQGRKRVPETLDERLLSLTRALPPELHFELRSRITVVHLMDRLYAIQDALLRGRSGSHHDDGPEGWPQAS